MQENTEPLRADLARQGYEFGLPLAATGGQRDRRAIITDDFIIDVQAVDLGYGYWRS